MSSKQELPKKRRSFFKTVILPILFAYCVYLLIETQIEISEKNAEYNNIHNQLELIEAENEQLLRYAQEENRAEYIEELARSKLGYAHPQEQIFYVIPAE